MLNHITNNLTFSGDYKEIDKLRRAIRPDDDKVEEDRKYIDFNKIVPMPDSLNITSGTSTDYGVAVILFKEKKDATKLLTILEYPWVKSEGIKTLDALAEHLVSKGSANLEEGRKALENRNKYGHQDWYSWSSENWGTKWNAYSQTADGLEYISFDTAWAMPEPIIRKMSEMFPTVTIHIKYAHEDFGHNCGELTFLNGEMIAHNIPEGGSTEAYLIASDVKGADLEEFIQRFAETDDKEDASKFVETMLQLFPHNEVVEQAVDYKYVSIVFLKELKSTLLSLECYELVGQVEASIREKENK